jgi:hypothetical protein
MASSRDEPEQSMCCDGTNISTTPEAATIQHLEQFSHSELKQFTETVWPKICDDVTEIHLSGNSCSMTQAVRLLRMASSLERCVIMPHDPSEPVETIERPDLAAVLEVADAFSMIGNDIGDVQHIVVDASLVEHILINGCYLDRTIRTINVLPIEQYDSHFSRSEPPLTSGQLQDLITRFTGLKSLSFPADVPNLITIKFPQRLKILRITLPPPQDPFGRHLMEIKLDAPSIERLIINPSHGEDRVAVRRIMGDLSRLKHLVLHQVQLTTEFGIYTAKFLKTITMYNSRLTGLVSNHLRDRFRHVDIRCFNSCNDDIINELITVDSLGSIRFA